MIKVKVYDVGSAYPTNLIPVLWLTDEDEEQFLVLTIGVAEAYAIRARLTEQAMPIRPQTHDLLKSVFDHFHANIRSVVITELREESFYIAEIHVEQHGQITTIDSRPSDAIAIALRAGAPIYVAEAVMREAGRPMPKAKADEADTFTETLSEAVSSAISQRDTGESPLEDARKRLLAAIEEERYEEAARLRDEIRRLEASETSSS